MAFNHWPIVRSVSYHNPTVSCSWFHNSFWRLWGRSWDLITIVCCLPNTQGGERDLPLKMFILAEFMAAQRSQCKPYYSIPRSQFSQNRDFSNRVGVPSIKNCWKCTVLMNTGYCVDQCNTELINTILWLLLNWFSGYYTCIHTKKISERSMTLWKKFTQSVIIFGMQGEIDH